MNIIQQYASAIRSGNLKDDAQHHSTEVLAAAALASTIGSKLFRVKYAADATTYQALLTEWHAIVQSKAAHRGWPEAISRSQIARLSLNYWLNDLCDACGGFGVEMVRDVPNVRSDIACKVCHGSAKRPLKGNQDTIKYTTEMVESLDAITRHAAGQVMRKLASDMDLG